jgi:heterodisulfide reductase subunit C
MEMRMVELKTSEEVKTLHELFLKDVYEIPQGEKIKQCQQCGACSGSCPTADLMDYSPREVIAAFRAGMLDRVVRSNTIWLCTSCYYCTVRCPAGIKITDLMYELKRLAIKFDTVPRDTKNPAMAKIFIDTVEKHGRNHEVGLMMKFMAVKNQMAPFKFASIGMKLFAAGRFPLFAKNIKGRDEITKITEFIASRDVGDGGSGEVSAR